MNGSNPFINKLKKGGLFMFIIKEKHVDKDPRNVWPRGACVACDWD